MFTGPLPADIIAVLIEIFNINNDEADELDDTMLTMVGEGIDELPGEMATVQAAA